MSERETKTEKSKILAVVGPTASGKSALAVSLARALSGEVVSCDSMQIYRGMDIGTAKPTPEETQTVPHHLLDIAEPEQAFSMVDYITAANGAVAEILARGNLPIFCGGTGLYLDAFLRGETPASPGADAAARAELAAHAAERGETYLHGMLEEVDPESAAAIHPRNVRRVIRALEIYRATGVTKTEWDRRNAATPARFDATVIGIRFEDRELLYRRIEARVDAMLAAGLVEETARLAARGVFENSPTAAGAIGYKELLPYLAGEVTLAEATEAIKTATRRYAKRQMTWFSAKPYVRWVTADEAGKPRKYEDIVNNALAIATDRANMI